MFRLLMLSDGELIPNYSEILKLSRMWNSENKETSGREAEGFVYVYLLVGLSLKNRGRRKAILQSSISGISRPSYSIQ